MANLDAEEADDDDDDDDGDDHDDEGDDADDAPLGGAALRSCIEGEGEPPNELLLAAVACAAPGTVRGVPVQELREDGAIGGLDEDNHDVNLNMGLLILMLPAATSLLDLRCVPGTRPFARELSLLSHYRTAARALLPTFQNPSVRFRASAP